MSASHSPTALFGFWPFPERRSCFRLEDKASLALENSLPVSMLYCLPFSLKKWSKLRHSEVNVSGSKSSPFCLRAFKKKVG